MESFFVIYFLIKSSSSTEKKHPPQNLRDTFVQKLLNFNMAEFKEKLYCWQNLELSKDGRIEEGHCLLRDVSLTS